jgi:hypothetical protein
MKCLCIILLTLLFSNLGNAQNYEGRVLYSINFEIKDSSLITNDQIALLLGNRKEFIIKGGCYRTSLNGLITDEFYDYKTNIFRYRSKDFDSIYSVNASFNSDTVLSYRIIKKPKESVLGNRCQKIVIKTQKSSITVFFSKKYKMDKSLYIKHNYNFLSFIVNKTGALPLKTIIENKSISIITTAIEMQNIPITPDLMK